MSDADFVEAGEAFVAAARRAVAAGFDVLGVDCAHGGLLAGFLSPLTNRRRDAYGDSLAGRSRFPVEVVEAVRAAWPAGQPLVVRLTVDDWCAGGLSPADGIELASAMATAGANLVHVEAGQSVATSKPVYGRGYLTTLSDRVRSEAQVPTLVGGWITTIDEIDTAIAAGRADVCAIDLRDEDAAEPDGSLR